MCKQEQNTGDDRSTLALKPMGRLLNREYQWPHKMITFHCKNIFKQYKTTITIRGKSHNVYLLLLLFNLKSL